jgi:hypothetical protein
VIAHVSLCDDREAESQNIRAAAAATAAAAQPAVDHEI